MKERFGGLLAVTLGVVLITTGIHSGSSGAVGGPPPDCGTGISGVAVVTCPTGTINIAETTSPTPGAGDPTPPAGGWQVKITSTCLDPITNASVDTTVTIPDGSNATSEPLFVFTNENENVSCIYNLSPVAVTGFTSALDPVSPVTIPFGGGQTNSGVKVNLAETFVRVTPTTPATTPATTPVSSSASPILATTGPRTAIGTSVYIGIALCVLGGVMLFGGTFRRRGQHS